MDRREFLKSAGIVAATAVCPAIAHSTRLNLEDFPKNKQGQQWAEGFVFHDVNGSGTKSGFDAGIAGVCVSNGREVTKTDRNGHWKLPVDGDSVFFVIKPAGWKVPVNQDQLPQCYHVHRPKGSPDRKYKGLDPTGDLPTSIDFGLKPEPDSSKFTCVLFGDPQPRNQTEIDYISHDVVEQVIGDAKNMGCKFGLSLGDEMFDVLSLYGALNSSVAQVGIPWYSTVGNHDMNYDSPDNGGAKDTFNRVFGPTYYAFNYGKVHFVVLDDVVWEGAAKGAYHGEITAVQLEWLKNDLAFVPSDHLVVVAMHIPIVDLVNKEDLFRIIENRQHCVSLSAHTHVARHHFIGESGGWKGKKPHHHINHVTVCGSWWEGALDERGIPHATMSDGGPNGYSIAQFEGNKYKVMFRPASRPFGEQMGINLPDPVEAGKDIELVVNVFAGSALSKVWVAIDDARWEPMVNFSGQDPAFVALKQSEKGVKPPNGLPLPNPSTTDHLWKATLRFEPGHHLVRVKTVDMFEQEFQDSRVVRTV